MTCLEQYCEQLYQVSMQMETISAQKACKRLESVYLAAREDENCDAGLYIYMQEE